MDWIASRSLSLRSVLDNETVYKNPARWPWFASKISLVWSFVARTRMSHKWMNNFMDMASDHYVWAGISGRVYLNSILINKRRETLVKIPCFFSTVEVGVPGHWLRFNMSEHITHLQVSQSGFHMDYCTVLSCFKTWIRKSDIRPWTSELFSGNFIHWFYLIIHFGVIYEWAYSQNYNSYYFEAGNSTKKLISWALQIRFKVILLENRIFPKYGKIFSWFEWFTLKFEFIPRLEQIDVRSRTNHIERKSIGFGLLNKEFQIFSLKGNV